MMIATFKDFGTCPFVKDLFSDLLLYIIILFRTDVLIRGKTSLRSQVGGPNPTWLQVDAFDEETNFMKE